VLLGRIDSENDLRGYFGKGFDSPVPNREIARVRVRPYLNTDAEAANGRIIPQQPLWFAKGFDEPAERPYSEIRSPSEPGDFEARRIASAIPSYVEDKHFAPKAFTRS
jgi:hypothetical protein